MADSVRIVFNDSELIDMFETPYGETGKYILALVLRVERNAKRYCPVDTGHLRASITHSIGLDSEGVFGTVGTDVHYARFVEFGTRYMDAQPFLRPALAATRDIDF